MSHDRYFMDKVVDHLLVFKGEGEIQDFPGNYTQYREWSRMQAKDEAEQAKPAKSGNATAESDGAGTAKRDANFENKRKMSYKEKGAARCAALHDTVPFVHLDLPSRGA